MGSDSELDKSVFYIIEKTQFSNTSGLTGREGLFLCDENYVCIDCNDDALSMFRYEKEETFQLSILSLFSPDVTGDVKRVFSSRSDITFEAVMRRKNGSLFPGLVHKSTFISRNDKTCIISCQDVSRMRLIDRELRQNRDELEAIFNNEFVGIGLVGKDRRIIRANQKLALFCGYEKSEDLIGLGMSDFHFNQEQNSFFQELYRTSLAEHKHVQLDFQFKHRDGSPRWMSISGMMIGRNSPS